MTSRQPVLADLGSPALVVNGNGSCPAVVICEHASRHIPDSLNGLGLGETDLRSHIAWDIGAEAVSRRLAELLDAPLIVQRYSRLVYDCNRPSTSLAAMPAISETTRVPGNVALTSADRAQRINEIYEPFHNKVSEIINRLVASGTPPAIITVHTFTRTYKGVPRSVDLGVLHDTDSRLADTILGLCEQESGFDARRNEPYGPADGVTHTLVRHCLAAGLRNVMFEVRNDLVADETGQQAWASTLHRLLSQALGIPAEANSVLTERARQS